MMLIRQILNVINIKDISTVPISDKSFEKTILIWVKFYTTSFQHERFIESDPQNRNGVKLRRGEDQKTKVTTCVINRTLLNNNCYVI